MNIEQLEKTITEKKEILNILCSLEKAYENKYDVEKAKDDILYDIAQAKCLLKHEKNPEYDNLKSLLVAELPKEILDSLSLTQLKDCVDTMNDSSLSDDEKLVIYMLISNY